MSLLEYGFITQVFSLGLLFCQDTTLHSFLANLYETVTPGYDAPLSLWPPQDRSTSIPWCPRPIVKGFIHLRVEHLEGSSVNLFTPFLICFIKFFSMIPPYFIYIRNNLIFLSKDSAKIKRHYKFIS